MPGLKCTDFDQYPNEYPKTDRNCFDCLNLKMKLRVNRKGRMLFSKTNYASCKEGFILRSYSRSNCHRNNIDIHGPRYAITGSVWSKIDAGWRHYDWNVAGVCPHFNDMRKDDDREEDPISNRLHDSDGEDLPGVMPKMDIPGTTLGTDKSGD